MTFTKTQRSKTYPAIAPKANHLPEGYTVVIIGASQGIGEHIAKAYFEAGSRNIILTPRSTDRLRRVRSDICNTGTDVRIVPFDATKRSSYGPLDSIIREEYGSKIDCLICNAGGLPEATSQLISAAYHACSNEDFASMMEINFSASAIAAQTLLPFLLDSANKTLINITSASCHMATIPPFAYGIAKLALSRLTEVIAASYKEQGIFAVALHPGSTVTPGIEDKAPHVAHLLNDDINLCAGNCVWLSKNKPTWMSGRYMSSTWDVDELVCMQKTILEQDKLKFRMVV